MRSPSEKGPDPQKRKKRKNLELAPTYNCLLAYQAILQLRGDPSRLVKIVVDLKKAQRILPRINEI